MKKRKMLRWLKSLVVFGRLLSVIVFFITVSLCDFTTELWIVVYNFFVIMLLVFSCEIVNNKICWLEIEVKSTIEDEKNIVNGPARCVRCRKKSQFLWPQGGGICSSCLIKKYSLEEAKEGVADCFHSGLEALYIK